MSGGKCSGVRDRQREQIRKGKKRPFCVAAIIRTASYAHNVLRGIHATSRGAKLA